MRDDYVVAGKGSPDYWPQLANDNDSRGRRTRILIIALLLLCLMLGVACALIVANSMVKGDTGSYIIPSNGMTDQEAQALLDEQVDQSRITVSLAPTMAFTPEGSLRINFLVEEPNNGLSERLEIEQDDGIVYASGAVAPGFGIEWCQAPLAHEGPAVATVFALDEDGLDRGNPISVDVEIVDE